MKQLIINFFAVCFSTSVLAQAVMHRDTSCSFFKNVKSRNGIDTIVVKARYGEIFKSPDYSILKGLDRGKKLRYSEFGVDTGEEDSKSI